MSECCTCTVEADIGIVTIDSPPVNALSAPVRRGLDESFRRLSADPGVRAIVLLCAGRTFSAGADISEFKKPMERPGLDDVFAIIENGSKPVIAAIHGTALGGGYEFALVCHFRIAVPSARVGLPEVALGVLPGGGGTQRLPRIVGLPAALELMTSGRHVPAPEALQLGMIDALAEEGRLREDALAFARRLLVEGRPLQRIRDRRVPLPAGRSAADICAEFQRANALRFRGEPAPGKIVLAVRAAAEASDFNAGLAVERHLIGELWGSPQAAARQYYFFAKREAARPSASPSTKAAMSSDDVVSRLRAAMRRAAEALVAAGRSSADVDRACVAYGFPAGPFGMQEAALPLQDGTVPAADLALLDPLLQAAADEGARLVAESAVVRGSDIDVACVQGLGWPLHSGGPMYWAKQRAHGAAGAVA